LPCRFFPSLEPPGTPAALRRARHQRKQLLETDIEALLRLRWEVRHCLWMPGKLNWWIGSVFALGASLFLLGSVLSLFPAAAQALGLTPREVNVVFFLGSIPFSTAAYLQLYQAANAGMSGSGGHRWLGWRPGDLGWLSCALQFAGTLLFNVNTFDAIFSPLGWWREDLLIWVPNVLGSILFLISGYGAFMEHAGTYWSWQWRSLSWWVVFANLLGCIAFMLSAMFAIALPIEPPFAMAAWAYAFTGLGAVGFLAGSLLMLPEAINEAPTPAGG